MSRTAYPSDVSDQEWAFVAPYLTSLRLDAGQRQHDLRKVFNALRLLVRTGSQRRFLPHDLPPWPTVYQQTQRWIAAGFFEAMVHDLRALRCVPDDRSLTPTAAIFDGRTMQSAPESGACAGYDGHKKRKGSKVHMAVDTLRHLFAIRVTAANEQEPAQVGALETDVHVATGETVTVAHVDQGYTGEAAAAHGIHSDVVKLSEEKRGSVLLPRRWVVERSFAWTARFRRLVRDYERMPTTLAALHFIAFACLMLHRVASRCVGS